MIECCTRRQLGDEIGVVESRVGCTSAVTESAKVVVVVLRIEAAVRVSASLH